MKNLVLIGALAGLTMACATKSDVDELNARMDALEAAAAAAPAPAAAAGGAADADAANAERQARDLYVEARELLSNGDNDGAKSKLEELVNNFGSSRAAQRAERMLVELNLVGSDAQAITAEHWFQGSAPDVSNGTTLVVFWEKWCPHCRREVPALQARSEAYAGRMEVVGLTKQSRDTSDDAVTEFISENSLTYAMGRETGELSRAYAVSGIPAAALVKDGTVLWRGHPGQLTDEMIDGFLAN
jgi:thiol-disulfide isomerase/thioredoxin